MVDEPLVTKIRKWLPGGSDGKSPIRSMRQLSEMIEIFIFSLADGYTDMYNCHNLSN
jgi:hypothetical protein